LRQERRARQCAIAHKASRAAARFEATIDEQMMPAFKATAEQLKALCKWK
jgi:hypothetical protein